MKWGSNYPTLPEKATFKKPSLMRVKMNLLIILSQTQGLFVNIALSIIEILTSERPDPGAITELRFYII